MREPTDPSVSSVVREQVTILTDNIHTLANFSTEPGPVRRRVDREVAAQLAALGELRERGFRFVLLGEGIKPLENAPSRIEVIDLSST